MCAATEAAAGGNPRGVEGAAPYNRVSYCLLPIASIMHYAFCILHSVNRCGLRAANDRPYRPVHRGFCLLDALSRKNIYAI